MFRLFCPLCGESFQTTSKLAKYCKKPTCRKKLQAQYEAKHEAKAAASPTPKPKREIPYDALAESAARVYEEVARRRSGMMINPVLQTRSLRAGETLYIQRPQEAI